MKLSALISALSGVVQVPDSKADPDITAVAYRSQDAVPGAVFVAISGAKHDGHDFIGAAQAAGAAAVIAERPADATVPLVQVASARRALAEASAAFFDHPSRDMTVIGITGTNGKTTTAHILAHLLGATGHETGVIGTLGYRYGGKTVPLPVTTPESRDLQEILDEMRKAGVTHVVMEASSHAIDQHRVWACRCDIAVFTNLSHDHLDYHGDLSAYWRCKKRWFTHILPGKANAKPVTAVVNTGDARGALLAKELKASYPEGSVVTVSRTGEADCTAVGPRFRQDGLSTAVQTPRGTVELDCPLVGPHNLDNLLCAVAVGCACDLPLADIGEALARTPQVPGRLEAVPASGGRYVFVDYAHTPDALENVLGTLRAVSQKRLWCVFGCGGDRDREKRPVMGAIAGRLADMSVITTDNPRTESTAAILEDIEKGMRTSAPRRFPAWAAPEAGPAPGYAVEPNRRAAIQLALHAMSAGDTLLIAGKGHETYQIIGRRAIPFDDRETAAAAAAAPPTAAPPPPDRPLPWNEDRLLEAVGGTLVRRAAEKIAVTGIASDTRTLSGGEAFIALSGDNHDGHDFIPAALRAGASALIIADAKADAVAPLLPDQPGAAVISVGDPMAALGRLAAYHRVRTGTPVVGITGSNGKTSTRAMTASVAAQGFNTLATRGNFNNEIGLPLTLLNATPGHDWAILEMGMNHPGEIARLAAIAAPAVGVITNIGPAHLEFLGSLEGVMHAKGELLDALPPDGTAIINGDDAFAPNLKEKCSCPVVTFGLGPGNTVRAEGVQTSPSGTAFTLVTPEAAVPVALSVSGRFMVVNALAAAAVGRRLGIAATAIAAGLAAFTPVTGRMRRLRLANGAVLIDDAYNANPGSLSAAIESLSELAGAAPSHLVMGDMRELGAQSAALHRDMGRKAAQAGIAYLYATGAFAVAVADGAAEGGMPREHVVTGDKDRLAAALKRRLSNDSWVLLKGSRAMGMETMIADITTACGGIAEVQEGGGR